MRKAPQGSSRVFPYILAVLVGLALIWRIATPMPPKTPGPVGDFPNWRCGRAEGDYKSSAVNSAGTKWAGAWSRTANSETYSAVWIIDFLGYNAKPCLLEKDTSVSSVAWLDDKTIVAVSPTSSKNLIFIDAATASPTRSLTLKTPIDRVISWPSGSKNFVALLPLQKPVRLAVFSASGEPVGKEVTLSSSPASAEDFSGAGVSPDGKTFVFSVKDASARGGRSFYLGETQQGTAKHIFDLQDLPGILDGAWVSDAGALMVCSNHEKFEMVWFDTKAGKIVPLSQGLAGAPVNAWPDAPKSMIIAAYTGGYELNLATGKSRRVVDFTKLASYYREWVQDGRLYPVTGGQFVKVSTWPDSVDIREYAKNGSFGRNLLQR